MKMFWLALLCTLLAQYYAAENVTEPSFPLSVINDESFIICLNEQQQTNNITVGDSPKERVSKYLNTETIRKQIMHLDHRYAPAKVFQINNFDV